MHSSYLMWIQESNQRKISCALLDTTSSQALLSQRPCIMLVIVMAPALDLHLLEAVLPDCHERRHAIFAVVHEDNPTSKASVKPILNRDSQTTRLTFHPDP
jgi:hypothetical protein